MSNFLHMPDVNELKEELAAAKEDIQEAVKENPELESQSKFLMEIHGIISEKISKENDLNKLSMKDQISIIAHLNLFYSILEDTFAEDMEFDEDEEFDIEAFEEDEESEEER